MEREKKDLSFILILLSTLIGTAVLFQWAIVTGLYTPLRNPAMWERLMEKDALFRFLYVILQEYIGIHIAADIYLCPFF